MRTMSMHFVNSLRSYLSSKVENRLLGMNEKNYSLGDTFRVALECELKAIASERRHNKRNTITTNNINMGEHMGPSQLEDINEIHVRNPNYKGKNYDLNYQAKKAEANKQQQQFSAVNRNQYKAPYNKPATSNNTSNLASSSDIAGEVTLKTSVDGYQLLKMNELIKNAAAWRARMPKASKFDKYFDNKDNPKILQPPKYRLTKLHWQLWDKLPRTLAIPRMSLLRQWKCMSILETSTWRMSLFPAFRIDYPSSTTPTIIIMM